MLTRVLIMVFMATGLYSQNNGKSFIISSGEYYYGTGISKIEQEACDIALKELTNQIAVTVRASMVQKLRETRKKYEESVESIMETHSAATLRNVYKINNLLEKGKIECFCYMKKTQMKQVWNERRRLIAEMVNQASQYTSEHNITHALKLYTFAALLTHSLPEEQVIYQQVNYTTEIPKSIHQIISQTQFTFVGDSLLSEKEREITFAVLHDNNPVSLCDFSFWDGSGQVQVQARDGLATCRLVGASVKFSDLKLFLKTEYYENRKEYAIVENLWDIVTQSEYSSQKTVRLDKKANLTDMVAEKKVTPIDKEELRKAKMRKYKYNFDVDLQGDVPVVEMIFSETSSFLRVLESGHPDSIQSHYSGDPYLYRKVSDYVTYNRPRPLETDIRATVLKTSQGYELRRIRVLHHYPSIRKQSTEYLVLDFNEKGKLVDMNTCISRTLYERFVVQGEYGKDWDNREEIIKFLEKYRTAYLTRDIKTVDMMFAEEAIIIIGRTLETKKLPDQLVSYQPMGEQPAYETIVLNKGEYLKRQQQVFDSVEDLFLDFSFCDIVRKHSQPSIYGVEMRQGYFSSNYADEGYLFLLIDFDPDTLADNPLIYVRAWQPNEWNPEELIHMANYKIWK